MRRMIAASLCLAAAMFCSPALAQSPNDEIGPQGQALANCAGAVAAQGGLDVLAYPSGASGEWAGLLGAILARLNVEPGLEGMTGRYAASAARGFWAGRPRAQREAVVNQCLDRFGR